MIAYVRKGEWLEVQAVRQQSACSRLPLSESWQQRLRSRGDLLEVGNKVRLRLFPEKPAGFSPVYMELDVLYEDDFVLVVNKPAGIPVHPSKDNQQRSLAGGVAAYYEMTGQHCAVRHIHRLDADTTGPVLYAKCPWSQFVLDEAMRQKRIQRIYTAVVQGRLSRSYGTIKAPIGKDRHHSKRRRVSAKGLPAVTHYEVIETWQDGSGRDLASLLRIRLETGRTHQIRVHMKHIGFPLYGDRLYGGPSFAGLKRQALHGEQLIFQHPWEQRSITVNAPLPADLASLVHSFQK